MGSRPSYQDISKRPAIMATMTPHTETPVDIQGRDQAEDQGASGGVTGAFTMKEAAEVAGISVSTLRRRKAALVEAGATVSDSGWQVPMTALIAAGLIPGEGAGAARADTPVAPEQDHETSALRERIAELEHQVSELRHRAEVAEAVAAERQQTLDVLRIANESERMALRMLTGGGTPAQTASDEVPERRVPESGKSRPSGFLHRVFGGVR